MKKILFLLLVTFSMHGQTLQNPTYGNTTTNTLKIKTPATVTSVNFLPAFDADGITISKINPVNLPPSITSTENSAGAIQGFTVTNNGNGTVNIASGTAFLRATNDQYAPLLKYNIPSVTNLALTDNANNFVLVDYNGGLPALTVTTNTATINTETNSIAVVISRVGTTLDYISLVSQNNDANAKLRVRFLNQEGIRRANGASIGFSSRNLTLTSGVMFSGLIRLNTPAFNTASPDTFTQVYNNGSIWTRTTGQTQVNNTQYNNSGVLTNLGNNDFRTDYIYILPNNPSKLYLVLGTTSYTSITLARGATPPASLPSELQTLGVLVGRSIIQRLGSSVSEVSSAFDTIFPNSPVPEHNSLAGLQGGTTNDYQHLTTQQLSSLTTIPTWSAGTYNSNKVVKYLKDGVYYTFTSQIDGNTSEPQLIKSTKPWTQLTGSLIGVWNSGISYLVNDLVTYNGYTYQCATNNTSQNPELLAPPYWVKVGYNSIPYVVGNYFEYSAVNVGTTVYVSNINENTYGVATLKNHYWDQIKENSIQIDAWGDSLTFGTGATLNSNYTSYLSNLTGLKVINFGVPGETSTQIKDRMVARRDLLKNPVIIWAGRNNYTSTATVLSDIATMVGQLGHKNYLVLGIIRATSNGATDLDALNNALKAAYGSRFIDVQRYLVEQYNPAIPQDVTDHANDNIPFSLRSDWLHLNNFGYALVANLISNNKSFLLSNSDNTSNTGTFQNVKVTGNELPLIKNKGLEIIYDNVTDQGVIQSYDRLANVVKPTSIGFTGGSDVKLIQNGGTIKIGALPVYSSGNMLQLALTTASPGSLMQVPGVSTNMLAKGLATGLNGASQVLDNGSVVSVNNNSPEVGIRFQVNGTSSTGDTGSAKVYMGSLDANTAFIQSRTGVAKDLSFFANSYTFDKPITASPATLSTHLVTKGQLDAAIGGALIYAATLTQSGTSAPVATVAKNTIGSIVWTRTGTGSFTGTLSGAFPAGKTIVTAGTATTSRIITYGTSSTSAVFFLLQDNSGTPTDTTTQVNYKIEVYP